MLFSGSTGKLVPFAVEPCGYVGKEAVKFVNCLGDIAAKSTRAESQGCIRALGNAGAAGDGAWGGSWDVPPGWANHLACAGLAFKL